MPVEMRILDAIDGEIRCQGCGRFVKIGEGTTLGFWYDSKGRKYFGLVCRRCEDDPSMKKLLEEYPEHERV